MSETIWPGEGNIALNTLEGFEKKDGKLVTSHKALGARGIDSCDAGCIFVHASALAEYEFDKSKVTDGYVPFIFESCRFGHVVKPGELQGSTYFAGKDLPTLAIEM